MKVNKKILSSVLAVLCLLSCCSFSVFAADDDGVINFDVSRMSSTLYAVSNDGTTSTSYTQYLVTREATVDGVLLYGFGSSNRDYYKSGRVKQVSVSDYLSISPDTHYSLRFAHRLSFNGIYNIRVYAVVYSNGNITKKPIYDEQFSGSSVHYSDFSFKLSSADLGSSYKCRLYIEHEIYSATYYGSDTSHPQVYQYLQKQISIVNDDVGWLVKILNAIKAIPSNISSFFSSLGDRIGVFFGNLGDRISGFFDTVNTKINNFKDNVGTWFSDLKDTIKQKFIDLGTQIGEFFEKLKNYLLYFQHPVTTNSDGVLTGSDGKPVYTNPFQSVLDKVENTVYDWLGKISDFLDSMEQSRVDVAGYLENGSALVNGVLKASPALAVCITFAVGFFVIRKVVGR